ncbi:MAG: PQQ-binding-like beta-propeller repeat protein [Planctomycetales bacterium]
MRFSFRLLAVLLGTLLPALRPAAAQPPERRFRESVSLDVDSQVVKKLGTVRDYLKERRWEQAIEILHEIAATHGGRLIAAEPGRYVSVADRCNRLLAALPAEGLAAYRAKSDAQAKLWFEAGERTGAREPLERILREAYVSSSGDDALWLLGELAWERGDLAAARRQWSQLVPLARPAPAGDAASLLCYPDSEFDPAHVLARLVLCTVMEGDRHRAASELAEFAKAHPRAEGTLAGRTGNLAEILEQVAAESRGWEVPADAAAAATTFAGDARRNGKAPGPVAVGAVVWSAPLPAEPLPTVRPERALPADAPLVHHPVVWRDVVLVPEADRIRAWNLNTGRPWPDPANDDAVLFPAGAPGPAPLPQTAVVGLPAYTATVRDGRLFARLGTPVISEARNEFRDLSRSLVCLDLERGEGKLVWRTAPEEAMGGDKGWAFEGSPVVAGGRCYVTLRRGRPETQIHAVCLDAETGRLLWGRRICAAVSPVGEARNLAGHLLLAFDGGTLYHATGLGAIAAVDAERGTLRWVVTYESRPAAREEDLGDPARHGIVPCVADGEFVYAAPADSSSIFAIHAASGVVVWEREWNEPVRHLLGTGNGNLIVSGRALWGLDARTGAIAWGRPEPDPARTGYGRGLLVGDAVWWPTRETIEVVSQRSGQRLRDPIQLTAKGAAGGNLLIAADRLLIAQPDRLIAFGEDSAAPAAENKRVASYRAATVGSSGSREAAQMRSWNR